MCWPLLLRGLARLLLMAWGCCTYCNHGMYCKHRNPVPQALQAASQISAQNKTAPHSTRRSTSILVIVPTRELAVQVGQVFKDLVLTSSQSLSDSQANSQHLKASQALRVATVFGGVSINPQMLALRGGADIVVATPGRLIRFGRPQRIATR